MANSTIIYACSDDGLAVFNKPGTLPEWLPPRKLLAGRKIAGAWGEPGPPLRIVVIAGGELLLSENGGRTWDPTGPAGVEDTAVMALDYDPQNHILRATNDKGGIWVSTDGAATWQVAPDEEKPPDDSSQAYAAQLPPGTTTSVSIPGASGSPSALVAATPDGLMVSADEGATWTKAALPQPGVVTALARDPERRDRLYAATSTGFLFESGNRGQSWQAINHEPVAPLVALFVLRI